MQMLYKIEAGWGKLVILESVSVEKKDAGDEYDRQDCNTSEQ